MWVVQCSQGLMINNYGAVMSEYFLSQADCSGRMKTWYIYTLSKNYLTYGYGLKLRLSLLVVASFVSSLLLLGLETCLAWSKHCQPNWPGDMPNWHFSFRSIMLNWGNLSNSALSLLSCSVPVPCTPTWSLICCTPFRPSAILWMCSWFSLLALNVPVTNL